MPCHWYLIPYCFFKCIWPECYMLSCPNTARHCLNKQLEQEEIRNPLRWLPYTISAFWLWWAFSILPLYYQSTWFVLNSLTLHKMLKQCTTSIYSILALFPWRKQGGTILAVLSNCLTNNLSLNTKNHVFYLCMHRATTQTFFQLLW